jgi:hypothetical protein
MLANYKTRGPGHLIGSTKSRKTMNPKFKKKMLKDKFENKITKKKAFKREKNN